MKPGTHRKSTRFTFKKIKVICKRNVIIKWIKKNVDCILQNRKIFRRQQIIFPKNRGREICLWLIQKSYWINEKKIDILMADGTYFWCTWNHLKNIKPLILLTSWGWHLNWRYNRKTPTTRLVFFCFFIKFVCGYQCLFSLRFLFHRLILLKSPKDWTAYNTNTAASSPQENEIMPLQIFSGTIP